LLPLCHHHDEADAAELATRIANATPMSVSEVFYLVQPARGPPIPTTDPGRTPVGGRPVRRAAAVLCGAAGTSDVTDASIVLVARRHDATVISSDRADLEALDPTIPVVDC